MPLVFLEKILMSKDLMEFIWEDLDSEMWEDI